eukprot:scaffold79864_cov46-Attheya_sp.AAC.3
MATSIPVRRAVKKKKGTPLPPTGMAVVPDDDPNHILLNPLTGCWSSRSSLATDDAGSRNSGSIQSNNDDANDDDDAPMLWLDDTTTHHANTNTNTNMADADADGYATHQRASSPTVEEADGGVDAIHIVRHIASYLSLSDSVASARYDDEYGVDTNYAYSTMMRDAMNTDNRTDLFIDDKMLADQQQEYTDDPPIMQTQQEQEQQQQQVGGQESEEQVRRPGGDFLDPRRGSSWSSLDLTAEPHIPGLMAISPPGTPPISDNHQETIPYYKMDSSMKAASLDDAERHIRYGKQQKSGSNPN